MSLTIAIGGDGENSSDPPHPCFVKIWLRSLCVVPSGLN